MTGRGSQAAKFVETALAHKGRDRKVEDLRMCRSSKKKEPLGTK
jgi:hypothetical protein